MSGRKKGGLSLIKDIYYTMFLLCRHLTYYDGEMEMHAASIFVSIVVLAMGLVLCIWLELIVGLPLIRRWLFMALGGSIAFMNYVLFVQKHRGSEFCDEFSDYSELKQTLLCIVAAVIMITILVCAYFSIVECRHAYGVFT